MGVMMMMMAPVLTQSQGVSPSGPWDLCPGRGIPRLFILLPGTHTCVTAHCPLTDGLPGEVLSCSRDVIFPGSAAGL